MADIIVVLIVIVLLGFALRGAIRHFKGDSQSLLWRRNRYHQN